MDSEIKEVKIWELVKEMEEKSQSSESRLAEIKATMIINFGNDGKTIKGLVDVSDSPLQSIVKVITFYHDFYTRKMYGH